MKRSKAHDRIFLPLFIPGTRRVQKRFEKTRSRMVYHAILGDWGTPQQATDGSYWPSGHCLPIIKHDIGKHCLPFLSERSDKNRYRNLNIIGTIVMKANRINNFSLKSSDKKLVSLSYRNLSVNTCEPKVPIKIGNNRQWHVNLLHWTQQSHALTEEQGGDFFVYVRKDNPVENAIGWVAQAV